MLDGAGALIIGPGSPTAASSLRNTKPKTQSPSTPKPLKPNPLPPKKPEPQPRAPRPWRLEQASAFRVEGFGVLGF